MKSLMNSLNNMRWNRMFTIALPISILLFAQGCHGTGGKLMSTQSTGENTVNYPVNQAGN